MFTSEQEQDPHSEDFMCNELALSLTDMAQGRSISTVDTQDFIPQLNTHKFGIELPKTVGEALEVDRKTGTTYWYDSIQKEMRNNAIAFEFLEPGGSIPIGYTKITLHMVFDIKIDFMRKAHLVAGGHLTQVPSHLTYSSVVSRESVQIMFLIAALNDLQVLSADIGNAYLMHRIEKKFMQLQVKSLEAELVIKSS
jgi:hypothetical protein